MKYYNREEDGTYEKIKRPRYMLVRGWKQNCPEPSLKEVELKYIFDLREWYCETIEELRYLFYQDLRTDIQMEYWVFQTFLKKDDIYHDKVYEELGE